MRIFAAAAIAAASTLGFCQERPQPRLVELLKRTARPGENVRYSGVRQVELMVNGERKVITEFVLRDGRRSRTTYPEDSPRKGFVLVETPRGRWEYDPIRNEIRRMQPRREGALHLLGGLVRGIEQGKITLQSIGQDTVAGRNATGIAIGDREGNIGRKLWIDNETKVVLKAEQFGRVGERLAGFTFTRIHYNPLIRPDDFEPPKREGARVVAAEPTFSVGWTILTPSWLPPGFKEVNRGLRKLGQASVVLIHYSNGPSNFTIFQSQGDSAPKPPPKGSRQGVNMRMARFGNIWSVAVGSLEAETLDHVVQSIGRR